MQLFSNSYSGSLSSSLLRTADSEAVLLSVEDVYHFGTCGKTFEDPPVFTLLHLLVDAAFAWQALGLFTPLCSSQPCVTHSMCHPSANTSPLILLHDTSSSVYLYLRASRHAQERLSFFLVILGFCSSVQLLSRKLVFTSPSSLCFSF